MVWRGEVRDHDVVARPGVQKIDAAVAEQDVVTGTTEDLIVTRGADQDVGAIAAVEHELRPVRAEGRSVDDVVAVKPLDVDRVGEVEVVDDDLARKTADRRLDSRRTYPCRRRERRNRCRRPPMIRSSPVPPDS